MSACYHYRYLLMKTRKCHMLLLFKDLPIESVMTSNSKNIFLFLPSLEVTVVIACSMTESYLFRHVHVNHVHDTQRYSCGNHMKDACSPFPSLLHPALYCTCCHRQKWPFPALSICLPLTSTSPSPGTSSPNISPRRPVSGLAVCSTNAYEPSTTCANGSITQSTT